MNITPHVSHLPLATAVNPQTDSLRRENNLRQVIAQPAAAAQSAGEKGVASDKDRAKTPGQNNESFDFAQIRKQSQEQDSVISDNQEREQQQSDAQRQQGETPEDDNASAKRSETEIFAEEQQINKLQQRDREVRAHELAHASVGGAATGAPRYTFELGPDGKKYAVGGEVSVDLSPVSNNPQATIAKMQRVRAAALAPASPSVQDNRVANSAANIITQAQSELSKAALDSADVANNASNFNRKRDVFSQSSDSEQQSAAFDAKINETLSAQNEIIPERSNDIEQRALRVENFYADITQAYVKPSNYQFQITA